MNDFELSFSGRESLNNDVYQIRMLFLKKVDPQKTQFHVRPRCVEIVIEKVCFNTYALYDMMLCFHFFNFYELSIQRRRRDVTGSGFWLTSPSSTGSKLTSSDGKMKMIPAVMKNPSQMKNK